MTRKGRLIGCAASRQPPARKRSKFMPGRHANRRDFLKTSSLAALAGASLPYWFTSASSRALGNYAGFYAASERPVVGCIGVGDRWRGGIVQGLLNFGATAADWAVDACYVRPG